MSDLDTIRRTLQTHTPAGKDKRHEGCSCFAESLESLARVEAVIEAARWVDATNSERGENRVKAWRSLRLALSNLSPSTPVKEPQE